MASQLSLMQTAKRFYFTFIFRQTRHVEMYFDDVNKYLPFFFILRKNVSAFRLCGGENYTDMWYGAGTRGGSVD
jgi:hypothetical protein